jgi:hypothetical protein
MIDDYDRRALTSASALDAPRACLSSHAQATEAMGERSRVLGSRDTARAAHASRDAWRASQRTARPGGQHRVEVCAMAARASAADIAVLVISENVYRSFRCDRLARSIAGSLLRAANCGAHAPLIAGDRRSGAGRSVRQLAW